MIEEIPFLDLAPMTSEIGPAVRREWARLVEAGAFIGGPAVEDFERSWAQYCRSRYAIGVANGTDAIALTLRALGIGPGDEVVVPANTFIASAEAVLMAGATPRFADVSPASLLLTGPHLAAAITPRTRAVIVVHLYGQMPDMDELAAAAARAGLAVIEDAAQAHGATWRGRRAGSIGRAGCFSFYPGKNLGAFGDAGAIVTSDGQLAGRLRSLRDHGRARGSRYLHQFAGVNSRLDALQAAVLTAKISRLEAWNTARRSIAARYRTALAAGRASMPAEEPGSCGVYHLAVARVPDRSEVRRQLEARAIRTGIHYPVPCHRQAPYRRFAVEPLPTAERAADEVVSLPMFPHMSDHQVDRVCDAVSEALRERSVA